MGSVKPERVRDHDAEALPARLHHVREARPRVLSVCTWNVYSGGEPAWPGRVWMEKFASLTAIDEREERERALVCEQRWYRIHTLAVPGTCRTAIWTDPLREYWNRVTADVWREKEGGRACVEADITCFRGASEGTPPFHPRRRTRPRHARIRWRFSRCGWPSGEITLEEYTRLVVVVIPGI